MDSNFTSMQPDFSHLQDIWSCFPMIKRYIPFCLMFALPEDGHISRQTRTRIQSDVLSSIRTALDRLSTAFPYLAGQVIIENETPTKTGRTIVKPLDKTIGLSVRDLTTDEGVVNGVKFPTFVELQHAQYPFEMLDVLVLAPEVVSTWATTPTNNNNDDGHKPVVAPVLHLQANFVSGGLILTISGNHMLMDMTGMGMIIRWFAKACRGEPFTDEEIAGGNQDRRPAIPLFDESWQPGPEMDDIRTPQRPRSSAPDQTTTSVTPSSPPRWAYFNFRAANLVALKDEATRSLDTRLVPYISTDDALGAFCWRRITAARSKSSAFNSNTDPQIQTETKSTFCRVLSARKYLHLHLYTGHMVDCQYLTTSTTTLHREPLGETAARLRLLLLNNDDTIVYHTRGSATLLDRLADKSSLMHGALLDADRDLVLSSYANTRCCEVKFGDVLGTPDAVRRPRTAAWPGLAYVMPRDRNGDVAVAVCIAEADLDGLRRDDEFAVYAEYVG